MPKYKHGSGSVYKRGKTGWLKYYVDGKALYESSCVTDRAEARRILQEKIGELAKRQLAKKRAVLPAADLDIRSVGECVYFVQSQHGGPMKIGYSKNLASRLSSLSTASPRSLRLLAVAEGTLETEQRLHAQFAEARLNGE